MENGLTSQISKNHVPSEWLKTVHRKQVDDCSEERNEIDSRK